MSTIARFWPAMLFLSTQVVATMVYAGQFGPPEPMTKEGKISLGIGYSYFSGKLNPENGNLLIRQHEFRQNQFYIQAGYGFLKDWEAYLRVGGSDLNINNAFPFAGQRGLSNTFEDGFRPFGTFGVNGLLYDGAYFGVGPFLQASLFTSYKDRTGTYRGGPPACDIDPGLVCVAVVGDRSDELKLKRPWDVNLGISLQTKVYGMTLYGGSFAYWTGYKAEYKLSFPPFVTVADQAHYREKNNFGGFFGLRASLPWVKGVHVGIEGQFRNKGSVGISLNHSF